MLFPKKKKMSEIGTSFERLVEILNTLREKCPWDKKQTLESLRYLTIEETYELSDAIVEKDYDEIKKELGDILLHIVFYSKIGEEQNLFDIVSVIEGICEKLIRRHPHIYSNTKVNDEEDVKSNWEKIKLQEGRKSVLEGVPNSLPAMVKAHRMQEKARGVGFDWETTEQVYEKVQEEMQELQEEICKNESKEKKEMEFGDLLFALINYARFIDVNPEDALEKTNKKFKKRFQYLEQKALVENKSLSEMTLAEMDVWWNEAKKLENVK